MVKIEIEVTKEKAREWRVILADHLKRKTGKTVKAIATIDDICRAVLLGVISDELARQSEEAEKELR